MMHRVLALSGAVGIVHDHRVGTGERPVEPTEVLVRPTIREEDLRAFNQAMAALAPGIHSSFAGSKT